MQRLLPLREVVREDLAPINGYDAQGCRPRIRQSTAKQPQAFEDLKEQMIAPPIVALSRYSRPYLIDKDASAHQLGSNLLQEHDGAKDWRPVGY